MEEALKVSSDDPQPFIIGGGEIYNMSMNISDKIELTRVHHDFEGDTIFPDIDTFPERAKDNEHPHKKHYRLFVQNILSYIDKK